MQATGGPKYHGSDTCQQQQNTLYLKGGRFSENNFLKLLIGSHPETYELLQDYEIKIAKLLQDNCWSKTRKVLYLW